MPVTRLERYAFMLWVIPTSSSAEKNRTFLLRLLLLEQKSDAVSDFPVNSTEKGTEFTLPAHAVVFIMLSQ